MSTSRPFLKGLRIVSLVEGLSTLVLFGIAMPLKYAAGMPKAVSVAGSVHGALFVLLAVMMMAGIRRVPMPPGMAMAGIVAAVLPFGPFVFDRRLKALADNPDSTLSDR